MAAPRQTVRPETAQIARGLLPPLLVPAVRRLRDTLLRKERRAPWQYAPEGWQNLGTGWNDTIVEERYRAVWRGWLEAVSGAGPLGVDYFRALRGFEGSPPGSVDRELAWAHNGVMSYAYALSAATRMRTQLSIFDWGGGVGQFFQLSQALVPGVEIDYHAKDVPVLARLGREINPAVTFYADDESWVGGRFDLVSSISAFQFERDWSSLLGKLADAAAGHLFVSRLPVVESAPSFVVVQHAEAHDMQLEFCGWFLNRGEFLDTVERRGLKLRREFVLMDDTPVEGAPEQARYRGFLFERC